MAAVALGSMLALFQSVYKSIDIRAACFNDGNWKNILTVIRLSNANAEVLKEKLAQRFAKLGNIDEHKFKIVFSVRHFSEWEILKNEIARGQIPLDDLTILCESKQDLELLTGSITPNPYVDASENQWNALEVYRTTGQITDQALRAFDPIAVRGGFRDVYEAINSFLDTRLWSGSGTAVVVVAPTLARFEIKEFDPNTGELSIASSLPAELPSCQMNVVTKSRSGDALHERPIKFRGVIKLLTETASTQRSGFLELSNSILLEDLQPNDELDIRVVYDDIILFELRGPVEKYFTRNWRLVTPLYDTFTEFESKYEFPDLLLKAGKVKVKTGAGKNEPQQVFERAVCWFMNFLGFCCIKMDERQTLHERETKVPVGSVDLLAYDQRESLIILVNCSIKGPTQKEIIDFRDLTKRLRDGVLRDRVSQVRAVYFTLGEDLSDLKQMAEREKVRVYELADLRNMLDNFLTRKMDPSLL